MALMELDGVTVDGRLKGAGLALERGEVLGLIGANGAGKSTLLHAIAGLERHEGRVRLDGHPVEGMPPRERARRIGLLPQEAEIAWMREWPALPHIRNCSFRTLNATNTKAKALPAPEYPATGRWLPAQGCASFPWFFSGFTRCWSFSTLSPDGIWIWKKPWRPVRVFRL